MAAALTFQMGLWQRPFAPPSSHERQRQPARLPLPGTLAMRLFACIRRQQYLRCACARASMRVCHYHVPTFIPARPMSSTNPRI
eukprot:3889460-Rhodomonas_salina.2